MPHHPNVGVNRMPLQNESLLGAPVTVFFEPRLDEELPGTIVRYDTTAPYRVVIRLGEDGPYLDSKECSFRVEDRGKALSAPAKTEPAGSDVLKWYKPGHLHKVSRDGVLYVIAQWSNEMMSAQVMPADLPDETAWNVEPEYDLGPSASGYDVLSVRWLLEGDHLRHIEGFRLSPELTALKEPTE